MFKKERSTSRVKNNQGISTIKFWIWSMENVEVNGKTLILFQLLMAGTGILFILFLLALIKLGLFEYLIRIIEAFEASKNLPN